MSPPDHHHHLHPTPKYIYKIIPATPEQSRSQQDIQTLNNGKSDTATNTETERPIFPPSQLDTSSSYMHMSTASQIPITLSRFFRSSSGDKTAIFLLKVETGQFTTFGKRVEDEDGEEQSQVQVQAQAQLRWEPPDISTAAQHNSVNNQDGDGDGDGGKKVELFPHLYLFDDPTSDTVESGTGQSKRLWLKRGEVADIKGVCSEVGSDGWEDALAPLLASEDGNEAWLS